MRPTASLLAGKSNWPIALWLLAMLAAVVVVARSHFVADMSAFLPRHPTAQQQLLVDQITHGTLSRTLLIGIEGASSSQRAALSRQLARGLRDSGEFDLVGNGEESKQAAEGEIFLRYRYLMSRGVTPEKFTADGLHRAIGSSIEDLSSSLGGTLKNLFARDPTGEMLELLSELDIASRPRTVDGVWSSRDGRRAILVAVSHADGADTDAQERLLGRVRITFDQAALQDRIPDVRLLVSGSAVFAVDARAAIKGQVTRLSFLGALGMMTLLLFALRSFSALGLCLLPVLSGALVGTATVSLFFGSVHGITIGFGSTLMGEAVDYSIYYFIQSQTPLGPNRGGGAADSAVRNWLGNFWPTIRLGMLTSVCGYCALIFSGFPGLAQLGAYSIAGLITAALVTRFVLPRFTVSTRLDPPGAWELAALVRGVAWLRKLPGAIWLLSAVALIFLLSHHRVIWNPALSGLSPVSVQSQQLDESLRADLGAPQMRYLVVVEAASEQAGLRAAEYASARLRALQGRQIIAGFESPSELVPSFATQQKRQQALPEAGVLRRRLEVALQGLPIRLDRLQPFLDDVEAARRSPLLTREQLQHSDLALSFDTMLMHGARGCTLFLPIRQGTEGTAVRPEDAPDPDAIVGAALRGVAQGAQEDARSQGDEQTRVEFVDMAEDSVQIYARYFKEILVLSAFGILAIVLLLSLALKDLRRTFAVLTPLGLAVLLVMAGLVALGERLNLLHLVGLLLIVAVGSNYALFFNQTPGNRGGEDGGMQVATLKSLLLANASTTIGFGVLAFSTVPVLHALGVTVAPGAVLALGLSVVFALHLRVAHDARP